MSILDKFKVLSPITQVPVFYLLKILELLKCNQLEILRKGENGKIYTNEELVNNKEIISDEILLLLEKYVQNSFVIVVNKWNDERNEKGEKYHEPIKYDDWHDILSQIYHNDELSQQIFNCFMPVLPIYDVRFFVAANTIYYALEKLANFPEFSFRTFFPMTAGSKPDEIFFAKKFDPTIKYYGWILNTTSSDNPNKSNQRSKHDFRFSLGCTFI